jgi:hypothetical protein
VAQLYARILTLKIKFGRLLLWGNNKKGVFFGWALNLPN